MRYQVKRSRKQWLVGAPEYVLACYDNGGRYLQRYTILIGGSLRDPVHDRTRDVEYLSIDDSSLPDAQWGECQASDRSVHGRHIKWLDLPQRVRDTVISECERVKENYYV